jgi:lipopolysaccharide transport system ATP-binding protein
MTASIRVRDVTKTFALAEHGGGPVSLMEALRRGRRDTVHREVHALRGVSFEAHESERIGVIGRNGAGKTTLLSLIAGITEVTSGSIAISGDVHAMLTIGAVLREEATGRENIYLDGAVHGLSREAVDAHAEAIIAFSELGEFIDRPVRSYSSGMKGRLAFSMGAFIEPDILIIDETLSVGDAFFAKKATRRMHEIAEKGRIVILVSHGLASIVEMCNRCFWLDQGRLVMDGSPKAVTEAYEAAVDQADQQELARKFGAGEAISRRPHAGALAEIGLAQKDVPIATSARAFAPLSVTVAGDLAAETRAADLELSLIRVDGRRILRRRLSAAGERMPHGGPFRVVIDFDPFLLGTDLYRLDVALFDAGGPIDSRTRVFEVVDDQGQFGGKPLLLYPPVITVRPLKDDRQ